MESTGKLYYDAETVRETDVPKIARVLDLRPPPDVRGLVGRLLAQAGGDHEPELREALFAAISIREDGPRVEAEGRAANIVSFPAMNGRNGTRPAGSPGRAIAEADDLNPYEAEELEFPPGRARGRRRARRRAAVIAGCHHVAGEPGARRSDRPGG